MISRTNHTRNDRGFADIRYRLGVDIGGTFTDIVLLGSDGSIRTRKVLSTPDNYSRGVVEGSVGLMAEHGIAKTAVDSIVHATTVASNTVLERRGARTALITTAGFRDVLEMRRLRIPVLYDLQYQKPAPLVPRRLRFEIEERTGPKGEVWQELDTAAVEAIAGQLRSAGVEALAICFLHSYANPEHERQVERIIRNAGSDDFYITCSADILPEIREYERMSTAVVNSYLGPVIDGYLASLVDHLRAEGLDIPVEVMQSGGGRMSPTAAVRSPAHLVESGPAAGVIACAQLARLTGYSNLISLDMGGTTAKAAIIEDGKPVKTTEYEVGAGINLSSKLIKGGGYPIRLPIIDVSEIGAGGGSIVSIDAAGAVTVGPRSAGSVPGPICYDAGGTQATLTDALLVLGYLNPDSLAGGTLNLNYEKALQGITQQVAAPLEKSALEAAFGVFTLAVATMTRAVKAVSTYRGRDPRDFILCGFGGNGPVTAVEVARALKMSRVILPPMPGVFSALGLLFAETEREVVRTLMVKLQHTPGKFLEHVYRSLEKEAMQALVDQGHKADHVKFTRVASIRYSGQSYELDVALPAEPVNVDRMKDLFVDEHRQTYGHASTSDPMDIVALRILAQVVDTTRKDYNPLSGLRGQQNGKEGSRQAYFGPQYGILEVPVVSRLSLSGSGRPGPLLIDEYDSTCLVPPNCVASLDNFGNIEIEIYDEE